MHLLKKLTSLILSALAVLVISGFVSLKPISSPTIALASSSAGCADLTITGTGTTTSPVVENVGNADSGTISFRAYDASYRTCVPQSKTERTLTVMVGPEEPKTPTNTTLPGNFLEGWAWNTNLGPVSFSCNNGGNIGIGCGSIPYGVTVSGTSGIVRGFAYGANIGWISMGCDGGTSGRNLLDHDCGGTSYGVKAVTDPTADNAATTCRRAGNALLEKGDLYGYAWTDTVGWINFCGGHLELPYPITPVVNITGIPTTSDPNSPVPGSGGSGSGSGSTDHPTTDGISSELDWAGEQVYANGSDSYEFVVTLKQEDAVLDNAFYSAHTVTVTPDWTGTTLRADQIVNQQNCEISQPNSPNCGAILPPSPFTRVGNTFTGKVKAIAPTNSIDKVILASVKVTIDGTTTTHPVHENERELKFLPAVSTDANFVDRLGANTGTSTDEVFPRTIYISATKYPGDALLGDALPDDALISIVNKAYRCDPTFDFTLKKFEGDTANLLQAGHDSTVDDKIKSRLTSSPCTNIANLELETIGEEEIKFTEFLEGQVARLISQQRHADNTPIAASEVNTQGVGFVLRVEYTSDIESSSGSNDVKYITEIVPNNTISNQAARVSGNVRIDVQKELIADVVTKSVGQYAQSKRDPYLKAISSLSKSIKNLPEGTASNGVLTIGNNGKTLRYFDKKLGTQPNQPCKIIINESSFANDTTLIGVGCDFYVQKNVRGTSSKKGKLGIIALADTTLPKARLRKGGNIYICNAVTDVEANIVAEGSLFPYGANASDCGGADAGIISLTGLPDQTVPKSNFKNQLTIVGSLISSNTYGGSLETPNPIMGDGTLGDITNPADIAKARLYDINYLRYSLTRAGTIEEGIDYCWKDEVIPSKYFDPIQTTPIVCENGNNPINRGIVNIIYRAPTKEMPVFGQVR